MGERPTTRSFSRLEVPTHNNGSRSRSPSPAASPNPARAEDDNIFFPAVANMAARTFTEEEVRQIAASAVEAALANVPRPTVCSNRKPDLPAFDRAHIEVWIQRVEAAYARASITSPKDKFAFLENKIDINLNPKLNDFLFGTPTATAWSDFLSYLREEYGTTKRQQAKALLDGIRRDGRRPSQFLAQVVEKTKDITIDDIRKEVVLRDLPAQVCHALAPHVDDSTAEQLAKLADDYFDREGQHLHASAAPAINNVENAAETDDEDDGVNAVGPNFRQRGKSKPPFSSGRFTPAFDSGNNKPPPTNQRPQTADRHSKPPLCHFHTKFGDKAFRCKPGCIHFPLKDPKATAGRRA